MRHYVEPEETLIGVQDHRVYGPVHSERIRAHRKHDDSGGSMERKSFDDPAWLPVLVEEVGEVARLICDRNPEDGSFLYAEALAEELVQVAAMACAWLDSINLEDHM